MSAETAAVSRAAHVGRAAEPKRRSGGPGRSRSKNSGAAGVGALRGVPARMGRARRRLARGERLYPEKWESENRAMLCVKGSLFCLKVGFEKKGGQRSDSTDGEFCVAWTKARRSGVFPMARAVEISEFCNPDPDGSKVV